MTLLRERDVRFLWPSAALCALSLCALSSGCSGGDDDDDDLAPTAGTNAAGSSAAGAAGTSNAGAAGSANAGSTSSGGSGSAGTSAAGSQANAGSGGTDEGGAGTQSMQDAGPDDAGDPGEDGGDDDPTMDTGDLVGWASVSGDGVNTTTGGEGGQEVTATNASELMGYAESGDRLIIRIEGTISVPALRVSSNKTLIGIGDDATIQGGVEIKGESEDEPVTNVIIKNLRIHGASSDLDGDGMHIYWAHHVWVDHCEIWDSPDGNLDIVHGSNWVTISWTKFWYSSEAPDEDHRFSNLIGHSDDNADEDTGRLKITWHHNWWAEGVIERMPRIRFGDVHIFNNYYSATGNNYCIGAGLEATALVENNYFDGVGDPVIRYDDEPTANIVETGNEYDGTSGDPQSTGQAFDPPYDYALDDASSIRNIVMQGAGPQ